MRLPPVGPTPEGQIVIKICESCGRLIGDGAEYTAFTPDRPTTVAPTIYRHVQPCPDSSRAASDGRRRR